MRESPRTWPSIRVSRLAHEVLMSSRMTAIFPYGVWDTTPCYEGSTMTAAARKSDHTSQTACGCAGRPVAQAGPTATERHHDHGPAGHEHAGQDDRRQDNRQRDDRKIAEGV